MKKTQTKPKKRRWLSKSRYAAKKRKEELTGRNVQRIQQYCKTPNQDCYVYHIENDTRSDTYVGYSTTLAKRIRQHNGELKNGANRTKQGRPWSFGMVLHFPASWFNKIHALQLEYACQHIGKRRRPRKRKQKQISLEQRIDNVLYLCNKSPQFTMCFPSYDSSNCAHSLSIYVKDDSVDRVTQQFNNVRYWNPRILPLSALPLQTKQNNIKTK